MDFQLFVEKNWKWLFGGSVFFLLLLLTPLGNDHNSGNLNWLDIPGFPLEIQPNEIIKIPFILLLSLQITKIQGPWAEHQLPPLPGPDRRPRRLHAGPDRRNLRRYGDVCGLSVHFRRYGLGRRSQKRWFLLAGSALVIGFAVLWIFILPNTAAWDSLYLVKRFRVLFDHSYDPQGIGFQQTRSILALGSGQLFGQGYLHGNMTQSEHASTPARPAY